MNDIFNKSFAVIIGVGSADIPKTIDDAIEMGKILKDPGRCTYPEENVTLLTGKDSSRKNIVDALETLRNKATNESTVIFYFSGHGSKVELSSKTNYYLVAGDTNLSNIAGSALSGNELSQLLRNIICKRMLILLDCCHAGGLDDAKAFAITSSKSPIPIEAQELLEKGSGRVIIASSREDEISFAGKPTSAFTSALIECLAGKGVAKRDGLVRVNDLALYASEKVPQRTKGRQHPTLENKQADNFPIAYYAAGDLTPKELPFTGEPEIEDEPGLFNRELSNSGVIVTGNNSETIIKGGDIITGDINDSISVAIGHGAHSEVKTVMGDNIENNSGNIVKGNKGNVFVSTSGDINVTNSFNKVKDKFGENAANILLKISEIINKEDNPEAKEQFDSFKEELEKEKPKKSTLKAIWEGVATALPLIKSSADIYDKVKVIFGLYSFISCIII